MKITPTIFSPPSKYDKNIPFAYEARHHIGRDQDVTDSYFSDTVCGLIGYLKLVGLKPGHFMIYEIYKDREIRIAPHMYSKDEDRWRIGNELCQSFKKIYPDHIGTESCLFADRSNPIF